MTGHRKDYEAVRQSHHGPVRSMTPEEEAAWVARMRSGRPANGRSGGRTQRRGPVRVYLAARYSRREELCGYAAALQEAGFVVTSRWLAGAHQALDGELLVDPALDDRVARFAMEDLEDVRAADICISFTEHPRATSSRGGRHVEFGLAYALGLRCIVVGHRENVFHLLPGVMFYPTWADCLASLVGEQVGMW